MLQVLLLVLWSEVVYSTSYSIIPPGKCTGWSYDAIDQWPSAKCDTENQCGTGKTQSPVSIRSSGDGSFLSRIIFTDYSEQTINCVNEGYGIRCDFTNGYFTTDEEVQFQAAQFHVHFAPEEVLPRNNDVLSLHIVHFQNPPPAPNRIAIGVVGLLFTIGNASTLLDPLVQQLPNIPKKDDHVMIDFKGFQSYFAQLHAQNLDGYWNYPGSLTTPPCAEQIDWTVMEAQQTLSQAQYNALKAVLSGGKNSTSGNSRTVQRNLEGVPFYPGGPKKQNSNALTPAVIALAVIVGLLLVLLVVVIVVSYVQGSSNSSGDYAPLEYS